MLHDIVNNKWHRSMNSERPSSGMLEPCFVKHKKVLFNTDHNLLSHRMFLAQECSSKIATVLVVVPCLIMIIKGQNSNTTTIIISMGPSLKNIEIEEAMPDLLRVA